MIKIPLSERRRISTDLKRFTSVLSDLHKKGKKSSEDDLRIVLNDMMSYVLGYDKYKELSTEQRERCGRLDYAVKLTEGPNSRKKDRLDFVVEAKAIHVSLSSKFIDQTMSYCLTTGTQFFILTNGVDWNLYKVKKGRRGAKPETTLIHSVNLFESEGQSLIEDFYIFSRHSYLAGNWNVVATQKMAANRDDIYTAIRTPKVIRVIQKMLGEYHGVKIDEMLILDIIDNSISKDDLQVNKSMEKKLVASTKRKKSPKKPDLATPERAPEVSAEDSTVSPISSPLLLSEPELDKAS